LAPTSVGLWYLTTLVSLSVTQDNLSAMNIHVLHKQLQDFATITHLEDVRLLLEKISRSLAFDFFIYALRTPTLFAESQLTVINGYPQAWLDHYFQQAYQEHDPVVAYCSQHITPLRWQDADLSHSPLSKKVMDEAKEFGLRTGISMPVHTAHGELGILSFVVNKEDEAANEIIEQALVYIHLTAGYLHEAVRRVQNLNKTEAPPNLTARELECLRWAADGKTSWEIAQLLKTSERTVIFHLNNASEKLNVNNRQHAVAKAALLGLIRPDPF
jgi:DNA-binding CsgD family transcriptional regulator